MKTVTVSDFPNGETRELAFGFYRWRRTLKLPLFGIDRWRYVMLGIFAIGDGTAAMWPTVEEIAAEAAAAERLREVGAAIAEAAGESR